MSDVLMQTRAIWRDYLELCKPNVVALMILTSLIGMLLSVPGMVPWQVLIFGNIGIAFCAASAATVNHIVDRRIDLKMARTINRPVAQGRIDNAHAAMFACALGIVGMAILKIFTNDLTMWLTFAALIGYAFIYTSFLKRATPQNIVIGGLAGAVPPLLGWTAVTNHVHHDALLLVLVIFAWTPPHFWALAIHRREDYAKAEIPMMPVTHGNKLTALHAVLYTLILIAITLLPFATRMFNWLYLTGALVLGAGFMYWSIQLYREKPNSGMETFKYSIVYLMALFVVMLVDHYLLPQQQQLQLLH
ncbi:MAG TPA: heme o synthase [Pseudomonadales bacterium]|nr:heme o synthase [Pseudomonadales bacterium]